MHFISNLVHSAPASGLRTQTAGRADAALRPPLRAALTLKLADRTQEPCLALVTHEELASFCGLNGMSKKNFRSKYPSDAGSPPGTIARAGHTGDSLNLDFHSVPDVGDDPKVKSHYLSKRTRRQPNILVFLAQDPGSQAFCYSNADIRRRGGRGEPRYSLLEPPTWRGASAPVSIPSSPPAQDRPT